MKDSELIASIKLIFQQADQAVSKIRTAYPELIPCRKGCTDCCHAVFDVSLAEALNIRINFRALDRKIRRKIVKRAEKAQKAWDKIIENQLEVSGQRIRCPLLSDAGLCYLYEARPVNCRTYGVPTAFGGKAHVCGLTGFKKGQVYTTLDLGPLHQALFQLSRQLAPLPIGARRYPISRIVLSKKSSDLLA